MAALLPWDGSRAAFCGDSQDVYEMVTDAMLPFATIRVYPVITYRDVRRNRHGRKRNQPSFVFEMVRGGLGECGAFGVRAAGARVRCRGGRGRTLSEIPASAEQIARESPLIKENMAKLDAYAASLKESGLRTKVQGVLENLSTAACPRPSSSRRHARTTIRAARIWESRQRFFVCARPLYQMLQKYPVSSAILDVFPGRRAVRCSPG